ncbi:MAG: glycosyltransferase family 2 protein [Lachnospiraceae bacterium]|nr:glycosyltransferase family 2 protein [Lachnospiraceae bacterium]
MSIVIPVYNAAKYLERSIGSVRKQTYENLEVICVDDGSKDESLQILKDYAAEDPRIKVISKENGGSSSARNAGLKVATGKYIGFIDADDYIETDMYMNLVSALENDFDADAAQILSCEEDEEGKVIKAFGEGFDESVSFSGREFFRSLLLHRGDSSFCTKLFRKDFFEGFSFSEGRLNEDFELLVNMSSSIRKLLAVRQPGYHIILRGQSNTRGTYKQSFYENVMENADKMLELTERKFPENKEDAIHFYLMQAMWFLLHIPADEMNKDNTLYTSVMKKVKSFKGNILSDKYLSVKHKRNLILFAFFPARLVKKTHERLKK